MSIHRPGKRLFERRTAQALALIARYEHTDSIRPLDAAIRLFDAVAGDVGSDHPEYARYLDNAGIARLTRFEALQRPADLVAALRYARATTATGIAHRDHPLHLSNRGHAALVGYRATQDEALLREAVTSCTEAVRVARTDDPDLPLYQSNLLAARTDLFAVMVDRGLDLVDRFLAGEHPDLIDHAVAAGREAIAAAPPDEPQRWVAPSNTAHALRLRFELTGEDTDLAESTAHGWAALSALGLVPPNATDPVAAPGDAASLAAASSCAINLSAALLARSTNTVVRADVEDAVRWSRYAVDWTAQDGRKYPNALSNFARAL